MPTTLTDTACSVLCASFYGREFDPWGQSVCKRHYRLFDVVSMMPYFNDKRLPFCHQAVRGSLSMSKVQKAQRLFYPNSD